MGTEFGTVNDTISEAYVSGKQCISQLDDSKENSINTAYFATNIRTG